MGKEKKDGKGGNREEKNEANIKREENEREEQG